MDDVIFQIVLLLAGAILGVLTQLPSVRHGSKARQQLLALLRVLAGALVGLAIGWIGYVLGQNKERAIGIPPKPSNVAMRLDFEAGLDKTLTLDICDAVAPTYYESCYSATSQLGVAGSGFTGEHSLSLAVESIPDRPRVYSINIPIPSPPFIDLITAKVYIPASEPLEQIWLLARLQDDGTQWVFSEFKVDREGWISLILDLRQFRTDAGLPANEVRIDEIDVDIFTSGAVQKSQKLDVQVDDLELHYPVSRPHIPS